MRQLLPLLLLLAAPAGAAGLASHSDMGEPSSNLEGLYAAAGGGGQLMIAGDNAFGYDVEGRLGYSFGPGTQIYLAGALDGATIIGVSQQVIQIVAFLQYHLVARSRVMVYTRVGIGLGIVPNFNRNQSGLGLAEAGGLGVEIRMGESFYIAPELFYRRATVSAQGASGDVHSIGVQLSLVYY
jgi:hypothetical protein